MHFKIRFLTFLFALLAAIFLRPNNSIAQVHPQQPPFPPNDIMPVPYEIESRQNITDDLSYHVAFFYVVPIDVPYDENVHNAIMDAAADVQAWYQISSGGLTWESTSPIVLVYHAEHPRDYYLEEGWWDPLLIEMTERQLPIWSEGIVSVIWMQGAGWWAGGAPCGTARCGVAMLGVEIFPEFNNAVYSGGSCVGPDAWHCLPRATLAHEIGHAFGLEHPIDFAETREYAFHSVMQDHSHYPSVDPADDPYNVAPFGLLTLERQKLRKSPFFKSNIDVIQRYQDFDFVVNLPPIGDPPEATLQVTQRGSYVTFSDQSEGGDYRLWTFGDSTVGIASIQNHTYNIRDSEFMARLRVCDIDGMMDIASVDLYIPPQNRNIDANLQPQSVEVDSGQSASLTLSITNTGKTEDLFAVTADETNWPLQIPDLVGPLAGLETVNVPVITTIPITTLGGSQDIIRLKVTSEADPSVSVIITATTKVNVTPSISVSSDSDEKSVNPGESAYYSIVATNSGNIFDSFNVTFEPHEWVHQGTTKLGPISPLSSVTIPITVTVPVSAVGEMKSKTSIIVSSEISPSIITTTTITTTVNSIFASDLFADGVIQDGYPSETLTYSLRLTNTGNFTDTYQVSISPHRWRWIAPVQIGPLSPSETERFEVLVDIPAEIINGEEEVTIATRSQHNSLIESHVLLGARATSRKIYLPVIENAP